jgi:Tripartite tricarboxylate transporter TctB family
MEVDRKDTTAGIFFIVVGGFFAIYAYSHLRTGILLRMGPGYFPLAVGIILALLGVATVVKAVGRPSVSFGRISWRGLFLISLAPIIFGTTIMGLGFIPSLALSLLVSAFASRMIKPWVAAALTVFLVVLCTLVFDVGLGLPLKLFGPWVGG